MKYILLIMLLASCSQNPNIYSDAIKVCKNHKGLDIAQQGEIEYLITCKDGTHLSGKLPVQLFSE